MREHHVLTTPPIGDMPMLIDDDTAIELERRLARLPASCRDGLRDYLRYGVPPGHFYQAVLCNDLTEAFARGDELHLAALRDIVELLTMVAPVAAWGSRTRVLS